MGKKIKVVNQENLTNNIKLMIKDGDLFYDVKNILIHFIFCVGKGQID